MLQKTEKGWREVLIDIDETHENKFKYVLSNKDTLASKLLINYKETRDNIEISKESISIVKHLAERIEENGGIALIADYGHNGEGTDTFRVRYFLITNCVHIYYYQLFQAFKDHKLHDPLFEPGSADLTADVDFNLLKSVAETDNKTICFGPVNQSTFLETLGIHLRAEQLHKNASDEEKKALKFAVKMMTDDDQMGKRFKLLSIFPEVLKNHLTKFAVIGFS